MRNAPTDIKLKRAEGVLEITWDEAAPRRYELKRIRCECGCAGCVDERTGVRTLDVNSVPEDIGVAHIELVGNYALKLSFSDGHDTGTFSTRCRRKIAIFSSPVNFLRPFFMAISSPRTN